MTRPLNEQLRSLPTAPGVYLFHGEDGSVLYVGKAKSLRSRVRSYFQRSGDGRARDRAARRSGWPRSRRS